MDVRKVALEVEDVAKVGASPAVNGLIRIPHDAQVPVHFGEAADQQILRPVGVLVFVDEDVLELVRVELARFLAGFHQLDGLQQQIVEIERAGVVERLDVALVDLADLFVPVIRADRAHLPGRFHAVLGLADARQRRARGDQLVVDPELFQRLPDDRQLIGRVVDDEVALEADRRRLPPQQPRGERMKRREPDLPAVLAEQLLDPAAHLLGGLVRERHREHLSRLCQTAGDEMRHAGGDDTRLPGTGAGEDQQRAVGVEDGFLLSGVQRREKVHGDGVRRRRCQALGERPKAQARVHAQRRRICNRAHGKLEDAASNAKE